MKKTWWAERLTAVEDPLHPETRRRVVRLPGSGIQAVVPWGLYPTRLAVVALKVRARTLRAARAALARLTDDEAKEMARDGRVLEG